MRRQIEFDNIAEGMTIERESDHDIEGPVVVLEVEEYVENIGADNEGGWIEVDDGTTWFRDHQEWTYYDVVHPVPEPDPEPPRSHPSRYLLAAVPLFGLVALLIWWWWR